MAIVGGALVTPIMGAASDAAGSVALAFLVPALCFVGVGAFATAHARRAFEASRTADEIAVGSSGERPLGEGTAMSSQQ